MSQQPTRASRSRMRLHGLDLALIALAVGALVLLARRTGTFDPAVFAAVLGLGAAAWGLLAVLRRRRPRAHAWARYESHEAHQVLEQLSYRDGLTQTWNRRFLEAEYDGFSEILRKAGRPLHLAHLDVDRLRELNVAKGRAHGDEVLRWVSAAFQGELYSRGYVFRLGSDEFALVLDTEEPEAVIFSGAEALAGYASASSFRGSRPPCLSVGIVTVSPGYRADLGEVQRLAGDALVIAKSSPRRRPDECRVARLQLPAVDPAALDPAEQGDERD